MSSRKVRIAHELYPKLNRARDMNIIYLQMEVSERVVTLSCI